MPRCCRVDVTGFLLLPCLVCSRVCQLPCLLRRPDEAKCSHRVGLILDAKDGLQGRMHQSSLMAGFCPACLPSGQMCSHLRSNPSQKACCSCCTGQRRATARAGGTSGDFIPATGAVLHFSVLSTFSEGTAFASLGTVVATLSKPCAPFSSHSTWKPGRAASSVYCGPF